MHEILALVQGGGSKQKLFSDMHEILALVQGEYGHLPA